jgi:outer membrane protein assembly factor BamB
MGLDTTSGPPAHTVTAPVIHSMAHTATRAMTHTMTHTLRRRAPGRWALALLLVVPTMVGIGSASGAGTTAVQGAPVRPASVAYRCGPRRRAAATLVGPTGRVLWRDQLRPDEFGGTAPVTRNTTTIFADEGGEITALAMSTGHRRWQRPLGTNVYDEWLIGGTLVVDVDQVGPSAKVVGLDPATGAVLWTWRPGGGGLYGNPLPAGGDSLVVMLSHPTRVAALGTATGRLRWADPVNVPGQPVAGSGMVAIDPAGTLHGFDLTTGAQRWRVPDVDPTGALALEDGTIAVASQIEPDDTPLAGYAIATGAHRWTLPLEAGYGIVTPTAAGFVLTQQDPVDQGGLVVVDPGSGKIRWDDTTKTASWQYLPVASGTDVITLQGRPGNNRHTYLQARSSATGRFTSDLVLPQDNSVISLAAAGGGAVLATGFADGKAERGFVERVAAGRIVWRTTLPEPAATPSLQVPAGDAFVQSEDFVCVSYY